VTGRRSLGVYPATLRPFQKREQAPALQTLARSPVLLGQCDAKRLDCASLSVFSGLRPSSGAETTENYIANEVSDPLERTEVAAAEDGRSPVNRYASLLALFQGTTNHRLICRSREPYL